MGNFISSSLHSFEEEWKPEGPGLPHQTVSRTRGLAWPVCILSQSKRFSLIAPTTAPGQILSGEGK